MSLIRTLLRLLIMSLLVWPAWLWAADFSLSAAAGRVQEGGHHKAGSVMFAADIRSQPDPRQFWQGGIAYSKYDITYFGVPYGALSGGSLNTAKLETFEEQLDYYLYSSMPFFDTRFNWQIGYRGTLLDNDFSAFHMGGPLIGVEGQTDYRGGIWHYAAELSPNFLNQVDNRGGMFYSFAGSKSISLYGDPLVSLHYHAWWWTPWFDSFDLALGYTGEAIIFESTDRYYNYVGLVARF